MKKNMKIRERKCRNNIGKLLSLMGFKDNNIVAAATVRNMLAKLREVEEKNDTNKFPTTGTINAAAAVHKNKNRSTIKRVVFKLGGKIYVLDQESPTSVIVPLEQPHSKTPVVSCNKYMELKDSRNIHPSCGSKMMIVGDHEDDDIDILDSRKNAVCSKNPNVKEYLRNNINVSAQNPSTSSSRMNVDDQQDDIMMEFKNGEISDSRNNVVYSENPNFYMIHEELRINYNVTDFITGIGGTKAKLFFEKQLTPTDVSENHGRLLMPAKKVENSDKILTANEKMILGSKNGNISVTVFDPKKCEWELNLGQWRMGMNINYVLKKKWKELMEANKLKEHMNIQVWSFRDVEENLCFAVIRV